MNSSTHRKIVPSPAARAEAAAWVARLHGPNRTADVEAGFRRWLSDDPERAAAFELLTDTWEKSARLRRRPAEAIASFKRPGFRISFSRAALVTIATAFMAVIATAVFLHTDGVMTGIGEQRTLALKDGTRVYLNTDSRVIVHYEKDARRVELAKGEALFEVAKHQGWPFIVTAGARQVHALGTAFVVRRDNQNVAVTLVEGKVSVTPADAQDVTVAPAQNEKQSAIEKKYTLTPGERLTIAKNGSARLDQPSIERVTAWQHGQVALDDVPLAEAVAEMNRYSTIRLSVDAATVKDIRVSGIFRAGDSENFSQAVAKSYGLKATHREDEIDLSAP